MTPDLLLNCAICMDERGWDVVLGPNMSDDYGDGPLYARCVFRRANKNGRTWTLSKVEAWGGSIREVSYRWNQPVWVKPGGGPAIRAKRKPRKEVFARVFIMRAPFSTVKRELSWQ